MRGEVRRTVLADEAQESLALLVIGHRQHAAVPGEPLGTRKAVTAEVVFPPVRGIGPAEAIHRLLHAREGQIAAADLDDEDGDIDVVEQTQVGMRDVERDRLGGSTRKRHAHLGHVGAAEHADR